MRAPLELESAALQQLAELIDLLNAEEPLDPLEAQRRQRGLFSAHIDEIVDGAKFGTMIEGMDHLLLPDAESTAYLKAIDNDLAAQVRITAASIRNWRNSGWPAPPHYPWRIAVILRKAKRDDLELAFLEAYQRQFGAHWVGETSSRLAKRLRKVRERAATFRPGT